MIRPGGRLYRLLFGLTFLSLLVEPPWLPVARPRAPVTVTRVADLDGRPVFLANEKPFFPVGVTYHFTRYERSWDEDLRAMKLAGLNTVRADLGWRDVEPYLEGYYRFDFLDRFLDKAHNHGLKVVLVFSYATQDYNTPVWFWLQHRDWRIVRQDGQAILGDFPSFNHPDYRRDLAQYLRATVDHVRSHPAILAYQVMNEPHYNRTELTDYNPYTIQEFRRWLQEHYGSMEALNRGWETSYTSFAEVQPVRWVPQSEDDLKPSGMLVRWADWRQFAYENLADFTEFLAETIKGADSQHAVLVAQMSWWWWGEQPFTGVSPTEVYRAADVVGYDVYPENLRDAPYYALNADMLARFWGKPVWVTELNRKDGNPSPEEIQRFVESAVEGGATGIFYFQWRDNLRDGGRYGLLDGGGMEKPQFAAFQTTVRWLQARQQQILLARLEQPDVYVVWPSQQVGLSPRWDGPAQEIYRLAGNLIEQGLKVGIIADIRAALGNSQPGPEIPPVKNYPVY